MLLINTNLLKSTLLWTWETIVADILSLFLFVKLVRNAPWTYVIHHISWLVSQTWSLTITFCSFEGYTFTVYIYIYQIANSLEVRAASTQEDLVDLKRYVLDFDDCVAKFSLQTERIKHCACPEWRFVPVAHLDFLRELFGRWQDTQGSQQVFWVKRETLTTHHGQVLEF